MGDAQEIRPGFPGWRGAAGPGHGDQRGHAGDLVNAGRRRRDGGGGQLSED